MLKQNWGSIVSAILKAWSLFSLYRGLQFGPFKSPSPTGVLPAVLCDKKLCTPPPTQDRREQFHGQGSCWYFPLTGPPFIIPFTTSKWAPFSPFTFQMDVCVCGPRPKKITRKKSLKLLFPSSGCSVPATAVYVRRRLPWQHSAPLVTPNLQSPKSPDSLLNSPLISQGKKWAFKC